jgi:hypothetical protein
MAKARHHLAVYMTPEMYERFAMWAAIGHVSHSRAAEILLDAGMTTLDIDKVIDVYNQRAGKQLIIPSGD